MIIMGQWTRVENNNEVPSFDDQIPTWPVALLVEHRTSKPKVVGSNPSRAK